MRPVQHPIDISLCTAQYCRLMAHWVLPWAGHGAFTDVCWPHHWTLIPCR